MNHKPIDFQNVMHHAGAAGLVVLGRLWLLTRELLKLLWRVTRVLVPVVLGALAAMVWWALRNPPQRNGGEVDEEKPWYDFGPCCPTDITHPDWPLYFGNDEKR